MAVMSAVMLCSEKEGVAQVRVSFSQICPVLPGEAKERRPPCVPHRQKADSCRTFKDLCRIFSLENTGAGPVWEAEPHLSPGGLSSGIAVLKQDMEHAKSPRHKNL